MNSNDNIDNIDNCYEDGRVVDCFKYIRNDFIIILICHILLIINNYYYGDFYETLFVANIIYTFVYFIGL